MNKTFEVVDAYIDNKEIKAYENGKRVLDHVFMKVIEIINSASH